MKEKRFSKFYIITLTLTILLAAANIVLPLIYYFSKDKKTIDNAWNSSEKDNAALYISLKEDYPFSDQKYYLTSDYSKKERCDKFESDSFSTYIFIEKEENKFVIKSEDGNLDCTDEKEIKPIYDFFCQNPSSFLNCKIINTQDHLFFFLQHFDNYDFYYYKNSSMEFISTFWKNSLNGIKITEKFRG